MRYVMLICGVEEEWAAQTPDEIGAVMGEIGAWVRRWREAGKLAAGGEELDSVMTAKTIRPLAGGGVTVTDGPYLELKEVVGGFLVLETENIDEAVAIAATWPALSGSTSIEVRPVIM
jgi:hypothetical protein